MAMKVQGGRMVPAGNANAEKAALLEAQRNVNALRNIKNLPRRVEAAIIDLMQVVDTAAQEYVAKYGR